MRFYSTKHVLRVLCAALLLVPAACRLNHSQPACWGTLHASGSAIPGVTIVATNVAKNQGPRPEAIPPGAMSSRRCSRGLYTLEASAAGIKRFVQTSVNLAVGQQARQDISMTVGEVTENVTVEARPPPSRRPPLRSEGGVQPCDSRPAAEFPQRLFADLSHARRGRLDRQQLQHHELLGQRRARVHDGYPDRRRDRLSSTVQGYSGISAFPSVDAIGEFKVLGREFPRRVRAHRGKRAQRGLQVRHE